MAYLRLEKTNIIDNKAQGVFLEPTEISIELGNKPFSTIKIDGSKTQNEFKEWKEQDKNLKGRYANVLQRLNPDNDLNKHNTIPDSLLLYNDQMNLQNYNFFLNHVQSYVTPYLLALFYRDYPSSQLKDIYKNMNSKLQNSPYGQLFSRNINRMASNTKGDKAANITSIDFVNNKSFDLRTLKGQYVIIDFWGSWCQPCIKLMPGLVEERNKYKDKNIVFVSVCRDYNSNLNKCKDIISGWGWIG